MIPPPRPMSAPHGWEWFDGVRGDESFQARLEKIKALTEAAKH